MDYIAKTPVVDRKDESTTHWRTVGAGFAKKGGMISIQLDSLPITIASMKCPSASSESTRTASAA